MLGSRLFVFAAFMATFCSSCILEGMTVDVYVDISASSGFVNGQDDQGVVYYNATDFGWRLKTIINLAESAGMTVNLIPSTQFDQHIGNSIESTGASIGPLESGSEKGRLPFGFYLTSGCSYRYVSGCISRNTNYCALRLHRNGEQLYDFHIAAWVGSGNTPCLGIYESERNVVNACSCLPPASAFGEKVQALKEKIVQGLTAIGLSYVAAAAMAELLAPAMVAGLAL